MKWAVKFPADHAEDGWVLEVKLVGTKLLCGCSDERTEYDDLKKARAVAKVIEGKVYRVKEAEEEHDFAWAMQQVFYFGRPVRRRSWHEPHHVKASVKGDLQWSDGVSATSWGVGEFAKLATDWELLP